MPFCSTCGAHVDAGSRFCMSCGSQVESTEAVPVNTPVPSIAQQGNLRQESITEINKMISYFGLKQIQYDEYDDCCEKISYYSDPESTVTVGGGTGKSVKAVGTIFTLCGVLFLPIGIIYLIRMNGKSGISNNGEFALALTLAPVVLLIIGIILLFLASSAARDYAKRVKDERARLLNFYIERSDALADELNEHFLNYGYCHVAAYYTNPRILALIREPLNQGRAYTIKDAINVMIQDSHNSEMELQAKLAARSAASAARGAKAAAFFSAANFIRHL